MSGEERLIEDLAADPSPYADLQLVLAAAKANGVPWSRAWPRALRTHAATPGAQPSAENDAVRAVLRETRPNWQAAYEGRALSADERDEADELAERRVGRELAA